MRQQRIPSREAWRCSRHVPIRIVRWWSALCFGPVQAKRPLKAIQDFTVQVRHGGLSLLRILERDGGTSACLVNPDLLDTAITTEDLVQVIFCQLVLKLHPLHGHRDDCNRLRLHRGHVVRRRWKRHRGCRLRPICLSHLSLLQILREHRGVSLKVWIPWRRHPMSPTGASHYTRHCCASTGRRHRWESWSSGVGTTAGSSHGHHG